MTHEAEFEDDREPLRLTASRRLAKTLAVTTLALTFSGSLWAVSGANSSAVDASAVDPLKTSLDITRAVPAPAATTMLTAAEQPAWAKAPFSSRGLLSAQTSRGGLGPARQALMTQMAEVEADRRREVLAQDAALVQAKATDEGAALRADTITRQLESVKREQERILAEKRAAEAKLQEAEAAKTQAEAERLQQEALRSLAAKDGESTILVDGKEVPVSSLTLAQLQQVLQKQVDTRGSLPLPPGKYALGSTWGQYGSWARWHTGQDFPSPVGTPVYAVAPGVVSYSCGGCQSWAGASVVILHHRDGSSTLYAHLGHRRVPEGSVVEAGTVLGAVGMKGRTFGPHLHFEWYPPGTAPGDVYSTKSPITYLLALGVRP